MDLAFALTRRQPIVRQAFPLINLYSAAGCHSLPACSWKNKQCA